MRTFRFLSIYVFLFLTQVAAASGRSNLYFRSLGVEDGLSQNMIYAILQDKQGFMWFATQDGLNRYDGNSFKVYRKNLLAEGSLKSDAIFSLAEDADGLLWIGTDNGVYLYNPLFDRFGSLTLRTQEGAAVTGIVRTIERDKQGNMWLAVSDKGVFCVTPQRETRFYSLSRYQKHGQGMIRDLCFDGKGILWIATYQQGVLKLDPSTGVVKQLLVNESRSNISGNDVNDLCLLDDETMLAGTVSHGLLKLNLRDERFSTVLEKDDEGKTLFVRQVCVDKKGQVWVGTETGGYIYSPQEGSFTHFRHIFNDPYSLSDNAIHSIYQDREGGVWLGTFFGGVNYFTEAFARFEKYYPLPGAGFIGGKSISEFCEDARGNVWIGTEDGGLNCFDPARKTFAKGFVPADNIHALLCDGNKLWIGSFSEGLFVLDLDTRRVRNYRSSSSKETLNNDNIYSIYKDGGGTVWIGTMTGLHRYLPRTDGFEAVQRKEITSQVNDIREDGDGVLWFATLGQGVFSYDKKRDKWDHYPVPVRDDIIRGKMVVCLLADNARGLWMGTEGAGLVYYDKRLRSFTDHFSVENGLPNNVVYQLLKDADGCVWGSTNKGLFRLDPRTKKVKTYTHSDGLLGDQFNYKSGFVSRTGKMYFGGVKGFVAFEPRDVLSSPVSPGVVLNSFQLDNVEVPVGEGSLLDHSITHTRQITLSHNQSIFSLGFAALSYVSPQSTEYACKLEGWDPDWIYVGRSHRVTYSNLPPGAYTFHVKVAGTDGLWGAAATSLDIRVLPPFYRTVWAYLCYAFLAVLLIYYGIRRYTARLKKRNREALTLLERQKEKELYDSKINFFTNVTHEIRTPLSLIKAPLDEVMKQIKPSDACFDHLSIIQRNANRLLKLVNELLDFRKAEAQGLRLNFVRADVAVLVSETVRRFLPTANVKNIGFRESYPSNGLMADVDVEAFTKVLSNLFNNALKHAATFVDVTLESRENSFRLIVANDGDRIPPEHAERIFDPFVKLDENSLGTGIGLPFARTLIEAHKGRIFVDVSRQQATFVLELPLRQEVVITLMGDSDEELPAEEGHSLAGAVALPDFSHRHVLLSVEDNEEFQNFMAGQLKADYRVLKARNGREALDVLAGQTVDLVISDVMMPVMDGLALCKEIKENLRYSHIPVILLTAKTGLQAQLDGLKTGADEYIAKPYSIDFLRARIENLLANRKKIRESYRQSPESTVEVIAHSKADEDFLNNLVEAIHTRLDEVDLDVDALAVMMNMSRATLYRKVKSISELTPNDFIRLIRLKKAAELLREKEYRINEIAFIVGFSSSSYFSKCFYKQFGVLPKDFERKKRAGK